MPEAGGTMPTQLLIVDQLVSEPEPLQVTAADSWAEAPIISARVRRAYREADSTDVIMDIEDLFLGISGGVVRR